MNDERRGLLRLPTPRPEDVEPTFISPTGLPSFRPTSTTYGSVGTRLQRSASQSLDPAGEGYDPVGYLLTSVAGWVAHDSNSDFVKGATLGIEETPDAYIAHDDGQPVRKDAAWGSDLERLISPGVKQLLDQRGFDYTSLSEKTFQEARDSVAYFLLVNRLEDQLAANTDGWLETTVGVAGTFGTEVVTDPLNLLTLGYASAAKTGSKAIINNAARRLASSSNKATKLNKAERFVLSAQDKFAANRTISGAAINTTWTRNHAAVMLAAEAGSVNVAFDLALQYKTDQILDKYLEPDAGWWDPSNSVVAGLLGAGLGYSLGKLFLPGADQMTKTDRAAALALSPEDRPVVTGRRQQFFEDRRKALDEEDITEDAAELAINDHVASFTTGQRARLQIMLQNEDYDTIELGKFMLQRPTFDEISAFLNVVDKDDLAKAELLVQASTDAYNNALIKAADEGKPLSNIEHHNYKTKIAKAKEARVRIAFPDKPKDTKLRQLAEKTATLRDTLIRQTHESANIEDINKTLSELRKIDAQLTETQTSITGLFREDKQVELLEFVDSFDRPRTDRLQVGRQADLMLTLFQTGHFDFPTHNSTIAAKVLNTRAFSAFSALGTRRHDMEQAAARSPIFSLLANMIHPLAYTNASMRPGDEAVVSLSQLYSRLRRNMEKRLAKPTRDLHLRAGRDKARLNADYSAALRVAAGLDDTDDELVAALAFAYRKYYDDMAGYGVRTGEFTGLIDDFVHITLNGEAAAKNAKMLKEQLYHRYRQTFMYDGPEAVLHIGTLMRAGIIDAKGKYNPDFGDIGRLRTVADIQELEFADGTSAFIKYSELLKDTLLDHADAAIENKVNALGGKKQTTLARARGDDTKAWRAVRSDLQRKIEQEFFLQDEILNSGIVELNPIMNGLSYNFGSGTRIARQDAVNRVTGRTDITWEGLVEFAKRDLFNASDQTQAGRVGVDSTIESLLDAERDISGRNIALGEGELNTRIIGTNVRNIGGAFVNPGIGIAMTAVEIPAMLVEMANKFGTGTVIKTFIRSLTDGDFAREQLRAIGKSLDFVVREHRHMAASGFSDETIVFGLGDRLAAPFKQVGSTLKGKRAPRTLRGSSNRAVNTVTAITEGLAEYGRMGSFEEFLTNRSRTTIAYIHMNQALEYVDKLSKLVDGGIPEDLKAFKGQARKAGFGRKWVLAQEMTDAGLTSDTAIYGMKLLRSHGVDNMADSTQVNRALFDMSVDDRIIAQEAYALIGDYAARSADNMIVNPTVWDRPSHSQNPMFQMINTFLSYPRGFRQNRLRPIADRGTGSFLFWSGFFLTAEIANRQLQAMVFKSQSPTDLLEAWEEDPKEMILRGVSAVPFLGPYQDGLIQILDKSLGGDRQVRLGGSPSLGITGQLVNDVLDLGRAAIDPDKEIGTDQLYRLEKAMPILNWVLPRSAQSIIEASQED